MGTLVKFRGDVWHQRNRVPEVLCGTVEALHDLLVATYGGQVSGLCLLDLTEHLTRLTMTCYCNDSTARLGSEVGQKTFKKSYLTGRYYCIIYGEKPLLLFKCCALFHGAVLGPSMFILPSPQVWRVAVRIRRRQPTTRSLRHQRHNFVSQRSERVHYRDQPMDISQ